MNLLKRLARLFKDEGSNPVLAFCDKLNSAIQMYGDTELPPEHPIHSLRSLHKEMTDFVAGTAPSEAGEGEGEEPPKAEDDANQPPNSGEAPPPKEEKTEKAAEKTAEQQEADAQVAKRLADAEAELAANREAQALQEVTEVLKSFRNLTINSEADAPIFKSLAASAPDVYSRILEVLKSAEAQLTDTLLLKEIGSGQQNARAGNLLAWSQIEAEADSMVAKGESLTRAQAIDIVMKKRPDLVKQHYAEI
jgi:hypothetical protein